MSATALRATSLTADPRKAAFATLTRLDGVVEIRSLSGSTRLITARPNGGKGTVTTCETTYPLELIKSILEIKGVDWLCDEISRDQDPRSIQLFFENDFLPYLRPAEFEGKRILDFGCGSGSSTMVLARMFPRSQIVGVELSPEYLRIAEERLRFYGYSNVTFRLSPEGTSVPSDLGDFDFIVMSAVFEHLLPRERRSVMPELWARLKTGGCLLLNQTPHRFFPFESHTTGLPFINYLPDRLAHFVARRFSSRELLHESWESLLRKGIRGASEREILKSLGNQVPDSRPTLLRPRRPGYRDRIDVWYAALSPRHRALKATCREFLRVIERRLGTTLVVNLALVIGKGTGEDGEGACAAR
ncbi:MAG: class I SAM-dependent methyltransferase [Vicinamibacteria bacterium]|nr:class I SAM-dependent methyltransferase [Vicinamibacteria bacterium]